MQKTKTTRSQDNGHKSNAISIEKTMQDNEDNVVLRTIGMLQYYLHNHWMT